MNWIYKDKEITSLNDFPTQTFGFVYQILHIPTNKKYIGKKVLYYNSKVKLGKKELKEYEGLIGRRPTYKIATKESNWQNYYGSSKPLLEVMDNEPIENFKRDILILAPTKKLLTYYETQTLFVYRVLEEPEKYFNDNILGKFFQRDFDIR